MPKKYTNPLMRVTATIAYYMELNNLTNKEVSDRLLMSKPTWFERKKYPEKFTLGELNRIAKILNVDTATLVSGLFPKEENS